MVLTDVSPLTLSVSTPLALALQLFLVVLDPALLRLRTQHSTQGAMMVFPEPYTFMPSFMRKRDNTSSLLQGWEVYLILRTSSRPQLCLLRMLRRILGPCVCSHR